MDSKLDPSIYEALNNLKMKCAMPYFIFGFPPGNDKEIVLKKEGPKDATWEDFLNEFEDQEPAFAVYDLRGVVNGVNITILIFIYWIPDGAGIKRKVVYATAKGKVMKDLQLVRNVDIDSKKTTKEFILEKLGKS